ncbi:MAG TPA: hypothetical protein VMT17_08135 [Anaeromyxobacteraceae bacterium]|nr:hypothetical protein [Anaeromyxobacteraceae bacterium]
MEELQLLAPGLLSVRLREGLSGHHPLFPLDDIREAFAAPAAELSPKEAEEVGEALVVIARDPICDARHSIAAMPRASRDALIRLYFRLLDQAAAPPRSVH